MRPPSVGTGRFPRSVPAEAGGGKIKKRKVSAVFLIPFQTDFPYRVKLKLFLVFFLQDSRNPLLQLSGALKDGTGMNRILVFITAVS